MKNRSLPGRCRTRRNWQALATIRLGTDPPRPRSSERRDLGAAERDPRLTALRLAAASLPWIRRLDDTRLVFLNSGRWDSVLYTESEASRGRARNPCQSRLRPVGGCRGRPAQLSPRAAYGGHDPGLADDVGGGMPLFLSEYGIGSAVDLWRTTRHFERLGKTEVEDAQFYRDKLDRYLADWKRWKLDELYARPEDFFAESLRKMAGQRTLGLNAIRANPNIVGYSLTGMNDHVSCGEGLTTTFRELKPGTVDAMFEGLAPLRLCLFAEPVNVYRGAKVRFEAVLANEDALPPGEYPVRLLVVGPENRRIARRR